MIYSFSSFFNNHFALATFSLLLLAFINMYLFKNNYVRFGTFFSAMVLGIITGFIDLLGFGLIVFYCALFYLSYHAKNKWLRKGAFLVVLMCSVAIMLVPVPGIENWQAINRLYITEDAIPYSMYFTFDKSLIGLFFIWFCGYHSLANEGKWKPALKIAAKSGLIAIALLLPLTFALGYVKFDVKLTPFFFLWAINNLFFVSIAEEALFRGMIQQTLMSWWQNYKVGKWVALVITASLFGAAHFKGGYKYMILASVAGLLYGYAYIRAKKIEASILTHFMVNSVHFVFFTYPALASAFE
ncbi:MAG: CPBP family intramembrane metalloprotease [Proteobacteria bacterium]|nr:CPBP family intramembrane metalloprotease [Pseudomonadota bacterium]